jgi:Concanavalin A-like lectin/glucanases superfamily
MQRRWSRASTRRRPTPGARPSRPIRHLRVDGSDGFFDTTDGFTIAAWVARDSPFESAPLSKMFGSGVGNSWQFEYSDTAEPAFTTTDGDSNRVDFDDTPVEPEAWVHLAGTWDGESKRFYVDGALRFALPFGSTSTARTS